jgi:hypothetical protein
MRALFLIVSIISCMIISRGSFAENNLEDQSKASNSMHYQTSTALGNYNLAEEQSITQDNEENKSRPSVYKKKSETLALIYSFGTTSILGITGGVIIGNTKYDLEGLGILASGLVFGPAMGYFYAGAISRGFWGIAIRGTISGMAIGIGFGAGGGFGSFVAISIVGGLVMLGDAFYDLFTVQSFVEKQNDLHGQNAMVVTPLLSINNDSRTYGLQINCAF